MSEMSGTEEDWAGGSVIGHGPFEHDALQTSGALWVAVAAMCLGAACLAAAVTAVTWGTTLVVWLFVGAGVVLGLVGAVLAYKQKIFDNVD